MSSQSSSHTSFPTLFEQTYPNFTTFLSDNRCLNLALALGLPPPNDLQLTHIEHDRSMTQIIPQLSPPPSPTHPDTPDPIGAFINEIMNSNEELDATYELQLQAANILHHSIDLWVNELPQKIEPVCHQHMQTLTPTKDKAPTEVNEQRYRLWIY
jgi:hypothetical protein